MEAKILKGKPVVSAMNEKAKQGVEELKAKGIVPTMAIVRVGEREDDKYYERNVMIQAERVGVEVRSVVLPVDVDPDTFFAKLDQLNEDDSVHGILMFLPLPSQIDDEEARQRISPAKDIDGCTQGSLARIFTNKGIGFAPCTAQAAMEILHYYDIPIKGKKAVVIGRSLVVGKPVSMMLLQDNATVTICHTKTVDLPSVSRQADIVIAAAGKLETIGPEYLSEGQTVIDVGINWSDEKQKMCGDVDFDRVKDLVGAITPVPGGVGSVTNRVLISHTVEAAKAFAEAKK